MHAVKPIHSDIEKFHGSHCVLIKMGVVVIDKFMQYGSGKKLRLPMSVIPKFKVFVKAVNSHCFIAVELCNNTNLW